MAKLSKLRKNRHQFSRSIEASQSTCSPDPAQRLRMLDLDGGDGGADSGARNEALPKTSPHPLDWTQDQWFRPTSGCYACRTTGAPLSNSKEDETDMAWPRHPSWHPVKDLSAGHLQGRKVQRQIWEELGREHRVSKGISNPLIIGVCLPGVYCRTLLLQHWLEAFSWQLCTNQRQHICVSSKWFYLRKKKY